MSNASDRSLFTTEVDVGNTPMFGFTVNNDTQLSFLTPAGPTGTWDVTVTTADHFTANAVSGSAPTVSVVSPNTWLAAKNAGNRSPSARK